MYVRRVRVGMHFSFVFMRVRMPDHFSMTVLMMIVMGVGMGVGGPLVLMGMLVRFPEQQDQTGHHQREGEQELPTGNAPEYDQ